MAIKQLKFIVVKMRRGGFAIWIHLCPTLVTFRQTIMLLHLILYILQVERSDLSTTAGASKQDERPLVLCITGLSSISDYNSFPLL